MLTDCGGLGSPRHPAGGRADQSWVRLSLCQALPELAQQRHLLASALPAGRGAPSARSPAGESLLRLLQLSDQKMSGPPGARNVPKRRVSALPVATCFPNFALHTQDTSSGPAVGEKRIKVPNFRRLLVWVELFCLFFKTLFGKNIL